MPNKYYITFFISALMILISALIAKWNSQDQIAKEWIEKLQSEIEKSRSDLNSEVKLTLQACNNNQPLNSPDLAACLNKIEVSSYETIIAFKGNTRVFWSDPNIPQPDINDRNKERTVYWHNSIPYITDRFNLANYTVYNIQSIDRFIQSERETQELDYSFSKNPSQLRYSPEQAESPYFFMRLEKAPVESGRSLVALILYVLGVFGSLISSYFITKKITSQLSLKHRVFLITSVLLVLRFITSILHIPESIGNTFFFDPGFSQSLLSQTLGDLLINIGLFYFIIILITKNSRKLKLNLDSSFKTYSFLGVNYLIHFLCIFLTIYVCRQIIFFTPLGSDLDSTEIWKPISFLSLSAIIILIAALFQLADYLGRLSHKHDFTLAQKMLALSSAAIVSFIAYLILPLNIHPFPVYLVGILFILLMDLYTEVKAPGINWLFIWVAILSASTTSLLYKYYQDKLTSEQKTLLHTNAFYERDKNSTFNFRHQDDYQKNIEFARYVNGERKNYNGNQYPLNYSYDTIPATGDLVEIKINNRREFILKVDENVIMVSGRPLNDITQPLGWYAYLFVLWLIFVFAIALINSRYEWLPPEWNLKVDQFPSFRRRIQLNILAITILSFIGIGLVTYIYLYRNSKNRVTEELSGKLSILSDDIGEITSAQLPQSSMRFARITNDRSKLHRVRPIVFDEEGDRLDQNQEFVSSWTRIPFNTYQLLSSSPDKELIILDKPSQIAFTRISLANNESGILGLTPEGANISPTITIGQTLNTLLKIYLFLGVLASIIAIYIANSISEPLRKLGERLTQFKLGGKNEPIEWKNPDELGELINNYNLMIKELEQSAEILASTERDTAWREMAKQVAHEIKNPLTPMKLSIQNLELAMNEDDENSKELTKRVAKTLIEQIDNLNQIASEFSNFAKMPQPANQKTSMNNTVTSVHDLFRERDDIEINLKVPIDELWVYADKNHLVRILNNLLKNAIQAIPTEKNGVINIKLYKEEENAVVTVEDNGTGIPVEIRDKVFKPNFTSKNSGTGLGLAICNNIVDGFNGRIFFETEIDKGTVFYLEIPLMRTEDNFKDSQRVIL